MLECKRNFVFKLFKYGHGLEQNERHSQVLLNPYDSAKTKSISISIYLFVVMFRFVMQV